MLKTNSIVSSVTKDSLRQLSKAHLVDLLFDALIRIDTLEAQIASLRKNSTNSSKPPSSDLPGTGSSPTPPNHSRNSRSPSGRPSRGQPGHKGSIRELVDTPDKVIVCAPATCGGCGTLFGAIGTVDTCTDAAIARSQVVDIPPIIPITTEYRAVARTCTDCGHTTNGTLPEAAVRGTAQLGPTASSLLVYLNSAHHLPYQRLQQVSADLFNLPISQETIANKLELGATAATPHTKTILDFLHHSPAVGSDETGVKVAGARIWQWVWQNVAASYYAISKHRDYRDSQTALWRELPGLPYP